MKHSNKIFAIAFGLMLMACGSSRDGATTNSNRTNTSTTGTNTTTSRTNASTAGTNTTTSGTNTTARTASNTPRTNNATNSNQTGSNRDVDGNDGMVDSSTSRDQMNDQMDNGAIRNTDYDKKRSSEMYKSLNMTEDQIKKYEANRRASMDKWTQDNPQGAMDNDQWTQHEDKNLKSVLDPSQYTQYQSWNKNNPYKN